MKTIGTAHAINVFYSEKWGIIDCKEAKTILKYAEIDVLTINISESLDQLNALGLSQWQKNALIKHDGETFEHKWQLQKALQKETDEWKFKEDSKSNKQYNKHLKQFYQQLYVLYRAEIKL